MKKWFWSAGGYYGIWSLTFFIGYLWIRSRYNLFAGTAASPEGRELLWYWVSGFGLLFILPLGIGQVAAGILSYRYAASRPPPGSLSCWDWCCASPPSSAACSDTHCSSCSSMDLLDVATLCAVGIGFHIPAPKF
ncbi:hypothetical protein ACFQ5F_05830 [Kroppenstedtia eburnea]|uniref:hypothetical protein n=1 Tax=Kroppenstedtia eburnea TaxID=714067 RepID=UPI003637AEFA